SPKSPIRLRQHGTFSIFFYNRRVRFTHRVAATIPASCQPQKPDSPAAAWYFFYLFHKKFSLCENFL
ncbi:MAG: hypothetical protein ACLFVO_21865, partial [Chloroflexaceae bacterium]